MGDKVFMRQRADNKLATQFAPNEITVIEVKDSLITVTNERKSVFREGSQFRQVMESDSGDEEGDTVITEPVEIPQPEGVEPDIDLAQAEVKQAVQAPVIVDGEIEQSSIAEGRTRRNVRPSARFAD